MIFKMFPFFRKHGILGINARNFLYIRPFNPKKSVEFADDKLKTKAFLSARGIPVAKIYDRIYERKQLKRFNFSKLPDECVLKPNYGYGGEGILILKRDRYGEYTVGGKARISRPELVEHIEDILDGKFSVNGRRDTAFFEQSLTPHESLVRFRPIGLPDIRIIVFNLVPVMAMLRIPTAASEGRANVHLGGIGIGIDIAKGMTTYAAQYDRIIEKLPYGISPSGVKINYWEEMLEIASRIQYITNIGYLAADITIDQNMGPTVLEVNARAGLMVQLANLAPLHSRLQRVEGLKVSSPEKGVRIGQDLFGEKIANKKQTAETEKPVLGTHETISVSGDGETIEVPCFISPEKEYSTFSPALIKKLAKKKAVGLKDKKENTYFVKFTLGNKKMQTVIIPETVPRGREPVIIGRRDLAGFLIDPNKTTEKKGYKSAVKIDYRAMDRTLSQIDQEITLLKYLKPLNLEEERQKLRELYDHNPVFIYPKLPFSPAEILKRLEEPIADESALGILFEKKRQELTAKIHLLETRGKNPGQFSQISKTIYGSPGSSLIKNAWKEINARPACDLPVPENDLIPAQKTCRKFEDALTRYGLHNWKVVLSNNVVADIAAGKNIIYLRADAEFTQSHIDALVAHEIETHVLTAENGNHQPFALFKRGFANYLDTQEGLAILNQNKHLSPFDERRFNPPRNLIGLSFALKHSFAKTRHYLMEELGMFPDKALSQTISYKRGLGDTSRAGAFTKSTVYFRGLLAVEKYIRQGKPLKDLYLGKIALEDLDLIKQIPGLEAPLLLPEDLREE